MVTDKFLIKKNSIDKALDKVEAIATCYAFSSKERLQIRLLAEETISVIAPALEIADGRLWVSTDKDSFAVSIDCSTDANGIDDELKNKLLGMNRASEKTGVFGMISKAMDFMFVPGVDYSNLYGHELISIGANGSFSGYMWSYEMESFVANTINSNDKAQPAPENKEQSLEMSIVEGYADNIKVFLRKASKSKDSRAKMGPRLEITVCKNFDPMKDNNVEFVE